MKLMKRVTKKGRKGKHKERGMERVIRISETAKREANNKNNESEQRKPSPFFSRSYSDRFISHQGQRVSKNIFLKKDSNS